MEEQPGHQPPQQQQQQQPPHHHHQHHHHHYYYYNHNHHQHHHQHLAEGSSPAKAPPKAPLQAPKHEPKHGAGGGAGGQQPDAPRKKAGYGELNGSVGERESPPKSLNGGDAAAGPISRVPNGSQIPGDPALALKQTVKGGGAYGKLGLKPKSFVPKGAADRKPEKCFEGRSPDKAEALCIPNGMVSSGYIANGYVARGADNDGSGSESSYTTPKKRKGRRNSAKGCEALNLAQATPHEPSAGTVASKQEPEGGEAKAGGRVDAPKPAWKCEAGGLGAGRGKPGDVPPRKNSDGKAGAAGKKFEERPKGKHVPAASSKEDSWTLFKPPPVFPVDNSSAKIVPKISYASKVKENLNKTSAQSAPSPTLSSSSSSSSSSSLCSSSATEAQAQPPGRLSQVPMSAMKSVTSAGFSNGPVLAGADRGPQPLLVPGGVPSASEAGPLDAAGLGVAPAEPPPPKSSLFIYPSNMQAVLLNAAVQAETPPPPPQASQKSLGDIFQNQWGLSFINEPSAGPEAGARKPAGPQAAEVTFQGEGPVALASPGAEAAPPGPDPPAFPKAYELDKRTSLQLPGRILKLGAAGEAAGGNGGSLSEPLRPGGQCQAEAGGTFVFLSKDCHVERRLASPTNHLLVSAKELRCQGGLGRKESWGDFDLRAAVLYHTQEMETICNLRKQDPKRIITYDEAMDHPDQ
ncbi:nuclear fragile X mental retardation-interacting protein 2 [Lacerta agilis]|uniref:nuclear fragile X mental retardation-interacting protein 2 n=1 Tax=Lacerta agilis TaxID=80427 RepID=UPI0014194CAA|nr:nuclear fragile X mental retardation-interacting protein 2 [Lacerta agilis]